MSENKTTEQAAQEQATLLHAIQNMDERANFDAWESKVIRDRVTGRILDSKDGDGSDATLTVVFTTEEVLHKLNTYKAGGVPQYVEMDFITITIPGRQDLTIHTQVTAFYEWRFRKEYEAFKEGSNSASGTPLDKWSHVRPADVKALNQLGIYTVEQVANLSESSSGSIRGFFDLRRSAQKFLALQESSVSTDLTAKVDAQAEMIEKLTKQLAALTNLLEENTSKKRKE